MSDWHNIESAPSGERILLGWREAQGFKEHVELGWLDHGRWVNTYGKPFNGSPELWAPLPVMDNIIPLHTLATPQPPASRPQEGVMREAEDMRSQCEKIARSNARFWGERTNRGIPCLNIADEIAALAHDAGAKP